MSCKYTDKVVCRIHRCNMCSIEQAIKNQKKENEEENATGDENPIADTEYARFIRQRFMRHE